MDDFRRSYPVAAPRPYRRRMGYLRGPRWERGEVEGFGLVKVAAGLPRWTDEALGYPYGQWFFAIFPEGDFYDGRENCSGHVGPVAAEIISMFGGSGQSAVMFAKTGTGQWNAYLGHHRIVICWMETHITAPRIAWPEPDDAPPQTEAEAQALFDRMEALVGNSLAKRRRLMMWLRARRR